MMKNSKIIKIRCKPHLILFLESLFGEQPIEFQKYNPIAYAIDDLAREPPLDYKDEDYGNETLLVKIPIPSEFFSWSSSLTYISPKKQILIHTLIYQYIESIIRFKIRDYLKMKVKKNLVIDLLMNQFDLPKEHIKILQDFYQKERKLQWKIRSEKDKKNK